MMRNHGTIVAFISCVCIILAENTTAQTLTMLPRSVAMLDLEGRGVSADEAAVLSEKLRGELVNCGAFTVVERGKMQDILKEQGFQQTGCTSTECAVQLGHLIGVQTIIAGSIGRIEGTYLLSIRMIDVASGKIEKTVQHEYTEGLTSVLKWGISSSVAELAREKNKPEEKKLVSDTKEAKKINYVVATCLSVSSGNVNVEWSDRQVTLEPRTVGFTFGGGVMLSSHYVGLEILKGQTFQLQETQVDTGKIVCERNLAGINLVYFYEGFRFGIVTVAPGFSFGVNVVNDSLRVSNQPGVDTGSIRPDFKDTFAPRLKIEIDQSYLPMAGSLAIVIEGALLMGGDHKESNIAKNSEVLHYKPGIVGLLNFGVRYAF